MIRLDKNENLYGFSDGFISSTSTDVSLSLYPDYNEVVARVSEYFGVTANEIMLTNGADEAIDYIMQAVSERLLLVPEPTFSLYEERALLHGYDVKKVTVGEKRMPLSLFSSDDLNNLTVIVNPANPSGVAYTADEIIRFSAAQAGTVVIDETYAEFFGQSVIAQRTSNMIIIRSFSKAWGLAGLRIGCVIADVECIENIKRVRLPYSVNTFANAVLLKALKCTEYLEKTIAIVKKDSLALANCFRKKGLLCRETAANFVLVQPRCAKDFVAYFRDHGVYVRELTGSMSGWVRITVAPEQVMKKVYPILDRYCAKEEKQ